MRKAQKKQAEEFVQSLRQANKEIRKAMEHEGQAALALDLLEQCQEGAIGLGGMIERLEGENAPTVRLLEDYCELLYQYHEKLLREQPIQAGREYKILQDAISEVEKSVQKDIAVRKEVVFLPYKASMWDALESIWRAADADPDCDAYVIPIPYYDKDPDNGFAEMHYEGGQYPKDVPVVWYEDYDIAERRPDVVFIHNPYDEGNRVTSVHPDFYASKLKDLTDKLVYIPYFVLEEFDPKDRERVRAMEHFCTTPGVLYAHQVVVQSETMRQIYVDVLVRYTGEHTRRLWKGKILGIGSPKVDKALNASAERPDIPEDWLNIIRRADGTWKKIIFYNTSIAALLEQNERMLVKMAAVFELFKESREEIALLWRPHPLIPATISSMRPPLWTTYERLVRKYRDEGWGIYDETTDMDRAIALCDAYYGDHSSLVQLCVEIGKPVLIQDVEKRTTLSDLVQLLERKNVPQNPKNANAGYEIYKRLV